MSALESLIEIDDELLKDAEENKDTTEDYYRSILPELYGIPLAKLPFSIVQDIAITCKSTESFPSDWMLIVQPLLENSDINVNKTLSKIAAIAEVSKELPLNVALAKTLPSVNQNVGKVIEVLLNVKLMHVLKEIKPDIENLLKTLKKRINDKKQNELYQCNLVSENATSNYMLDLPNKKCLKVFIPHMDSVSETAGKFSELLRVEYNFQARAMCEIEDLLAVNSHGVLDTILCTADFVLPIISADYMDVITFTNGLLKEDDDSKDKMRNRYVYNWLGNDFETNGCLNFRCRAVIVDGVDIKRVRRIPLFFHFFKLSDVQKLVDQLYCTKQYRHILKK